MPICFRLLVHWMRRAASRAAWTAGKSSAIRTAMMAITTNNSMSVKPLRRTLMEVLLNRGTEVDRAGAGPRDRSDSRKPNERNGRRGGRADVHGATLLRSARRADDQASPCGES